MLNQYIINAFTNEAKLIFKRQISPHVYHIKLFDTCIHNLKFQAGQHLHVLVNPNFNGSIIRAATNRSYSIWGHDPEKGTLDVAVCTFSGGPGAKWVKSLITGDKVYFTDPTGKFTLVQQTDLHVLIGYIFIIPLLPNEKRDKSF